MEQALTATQITIFLLGGLGLFFLGIRVLWFVSVYKENKEKYRQRTARPRISLVEFRKEIRVICYPLLRFNTA